MRTNNRPDFCFSAAVLSGVDAADLCDEIGLIDSAADDEDLFDDIVEAATACHRSDRMAESSGSTFRFSDELAVLL